MCKESLQREKGGAGLAFISCDSQGRRSLSKGDRRPLNGTCTLAARFFFFFPSLLFFPPVSSRLILRRAAFLQPANFLTPSLAHFRYSPPHYSRSRLHYRLPSFLFHSFLPAFLRSLSITRSCTFPPRTHTHTSGCTLSGRPVTQDVVISL